MMRYPTTRSMVGYAISPQLQSYVARVQSENPSGTAIKKTADAAPAGSS